MYPQERISPGYNIQMLLSFNMGTDFLNVGALNSCCCATKYLVEPNVCRSMRRVRTRVSTSDAPLVTSSAFFSSTHEEATAPAWHYLNPLSDVELHSRPDVYTKCDIRAWIGVGCRLKTAEGAHLKFLTCFPTRIYDLRRTK